MARRGVGSKTVATERITRERTGRIAIIRQQSANQSSAKKSSFIFESNDVLKALKKVKKLGFQGVN